MQGENEMSRKTKLIAFPGGGIIPSEINDGKGDKEIPPHEPVRVPIEYGDSLINDRFAVEVPQTEMKKKPANKKTAADPDIEALKTKVAQAEKAVAAAKTDETKAKAQEFLDEAKKALTDAQSGS
jgi:predicted lipid-binding transport protein (Tim44 family)